jgi:hypothetical protein
MISLKLAASTEALAVLVNLQPVHYPRSRTNRLKLGLSEDFGLFSFSDLNTTELYHIE